MEIGSEFWNVEISKNTQLLLNSSHEYLLSGRTALDFIIRDITALKKINTIYMPSYCCQSMIRTFKDNEINVEFYNVHFLNNQYVYDFNYETQCDAVLIMQYFGFINESVYQAINIFKERGQIIIEDATHSWFSEKSYHKNSDYVFASFRKWTGLACGAIVMKQKGTFQIESPKTTNLDYIAIRQNAAFLKRLYIEKMIGQKEEYMNMFSQAEGLLENDYRNYNIPNNFKTAIRSLNSEKISKKRKINAEYLTKNLSRNNHINTIIQSKGDVPLFVPIIINNGKRNDLQKYLINKNIYCPIHWPNSNIQRIRNCFLYKSSLSIICDQRYDISDMNTIVESINNFFSKDI